MKNNPLKSLNDNFYFFKKEDFKKIVLFYRKNIENYKENEELIPKYYYSLTDEYVKTHRIVKCGQGLKQARFNQEEVNEILNTLKDMSIRKTADKYNCSTKTIQEIKKGIYTPRKTKEEE